MKIEKIMEIAAPLSEIAKKKLPIRVSYIITSNIEKLNKYVESSDKKRAELIRQYGEKDENGELIIGENGEVRIINKDAFTEDLQELLDTDIDLVLDTISLSDLEKCETEDRYDLLTVEEIRYLQPMIKKEDEA